MNDRKEKILNKLYSLLRGSIHPGLERISEMLRTTGNPQDKFTTVHVAGTNGKGSVSSIIASVSMESGIKTGLYTSPHISHFGERIRINGEMISDEDLVRLAETYLPFADSISATFFEITTAMAFRYFADNGVQFAVIETGMGGRADATNVISPIACALTSISIDHCEYLGNSIEEIAYEKAGIIKPGTPCFVSKNSDEVMAIVKDYSRKVGGQLSYVPDLLVPVGIRYNKDFTTSIRLAGTQGAETEYCNPLPGRHQTENLALALSVCKVLVQAGLASRDKFQIGLDNLKKNTGLFGRVECLRDAPPLVLDVSHNAEGLAALVDTISLHTDQELPWKIVFAGMADKDIRAMLLQLLSISSEVLIPQLRIERAMKAERIAEIAREVGFERVRTYNCMEGAISAALSGAGGVLVAGSFHVAEEAIECLENYSSE